MDDYSPEEKNLFLSQGLLGLGAGLLSGSFGHYGAFAPALGQGAQGFQQGYGNAMQSAFQLRQLKQQKALQDAQIGNYNSEAEKRRADMAAAERQRQLAQQADDYARSKLNPAPNLPAPNVPTVPSNTGGVTIQTPTTRYETAPTTEVTAQTKSNLLNPDYHLAKAEYLYRNGDLKGAEEAAKRAQELRGEERTYNKDNQDKPLEGVPGVTFNPATGEYKKDKIPISSDEVQKMKLALAKAGATNVITNVSTEKKYGEQFAGKIADADSLMRDTAIKAPDLANRANSVINAINSGKIITGAGADYRLAFGKAMGLAGLSDKETIVKTETLATELANNTLDAIKTSNLGGGNGFSNADRDFLEKAKGGKITLEAGTIKRLAELAHKAASASADKWNKRVKMIPQSAIEGTGLTRDPIEVPPMSGGTIGSPPMLPKGWTIEEVK